MGPILTRVYNWFRPKPTDPVPPLPAPTPTPTPVPDIPEPSRVQLLNYIRALMILRSIPYKKLQEEFMKLPHKKIAYTIGTFIWFFMTYAFLKYLFGL